MGVRHIFVPGLYWDRRRPGGLPLPATMLLVADVVGATVCRRDGGGPSRDGQQASQRENVARTPATGCATAKFPCAARQPTGMAAVRVHGNFAVAHPTDRRI